MTEFFSAYQDLQTHYNDLLLVTEQYTIDKAEESGALGVWSARQVIAHLSGWVVEATEHYQAMLAGDVQDKIYNADIINAHNAQSVASRADLSWQETLDDLQQTVTTWFAQVEKVPAVRVPKNRWFLEWLKIMDHEFINHANDLRLFITEVNGDYPILEFDPDTVAVLNPLSFLQPLDTMPEHVVICFFREVLMQLRMRYPMTVIHQLGGESGDNPVYGMKVDDKPVALLHPGVGAPLAGAFMEEVIALGGRKFIACGGAGVLTNDIPVGAIVVPDSAIREEGTSYHYLPPSREVKGNPQAIEAIKATLEEHKIPYRVGKTWTTDAIYRETRHKVNARKAEGCLTVEMETAAFFAIAQFRDVVFGQLLYGGDNLGGEEWDGRNWMGRFSTREKLFWLAAESVLKL